MGNSALKKAMMLLGGMVASLIFLVVLEPAVSNAATDEASQTSSVTVAADTGFSVPLTRGESWYSDATKMSVTAGSTDLTAVTTVASNRRSINIGSAHGLTAGAIDIMVEYHTELSDSAASGEEQNATTAIVLKVVPLLITMGLLGLIFTSIFGAYTSIRDRQDSGTFITAAATVFLGLILVPVIQTFSSQAIEQYTSAPEYLGVGTILGLVVVGYVLGVMGLAFSQVGGTARNWIPGQGGGM